MWATPEEKRAARIRGKNRRRSQAPAAYFTAVFPTSDPLSDGSPWGEMVRESLFRAAAGVPVAGLAPGLRASTRCRTVAVKWVQAHWRGWASGRRPYMEMLRTREAAARQI